MSTVAIDWAPEAGCLFDASPLVYTLRGHCGATHVVVSISRPTRNHVKAGPLSSA